MLDDRINLGKALRPFPGYDMDFALGTTYSLSLEALMFIPATLFFGEDLIMNEKVLSSELLHALTRVPDQVQLFCQRGKIHKPSFYHNILAFWEQSIEQVHLDSYLQSFHPKIWLVRYVPVKDKLPVKYRFICGSRNLTLCRDWDAAVTMEGAVQKSKKIENRPLLDFVQMLNQGARRKIRADVLREIMHIDFELSAQQATYAFHPIGFGGRKHPLLTEQKHQKLLVISPFLHKQTIQQYQERSKHLYLFSNGFELENIDNEALDAVDDVYMFNPKLEQPAISEPDKTGNDEADDNNVIGNVEPDESYNPSMNLHAKLYISQSRNTARWFIGSANCTEPACERNIEFLTEIGYLPGKATIEEAWVPLVEPKKGEGLFVPFERRSEGETEAEQQLDAALRKVTYELAAVRFEGEALLQEDGRFTLIVRVAEAQLTIPAAWKIMISPLSAHQEYRRNLVACASPQEFSWENFQESELTPFLLVNVELEDRSYRQFVLDIQISFSTDRMKKIFRSILSNQEKLFKYLSALLTNDQVTPLIMLDEQEQGDSDPRRCMVFPEHLPLYEKLLLAASRDRKKLKLAASTIDYLAGEVDENGKPIIDDAFASLFDVFKPFAENE